MGRSLIRIKTKIKKDMLVIERIPRQVRLILNIDMLGIGRILGPVRLRLK